jgi:hypothetical protein
MKEICRMNRTFLAACAAVVMSAALVGAQDKAPANGASADANANANAVTFTGCLSPGSNADSYYLTNAKQKGVKTSEKTVKIVAATPKVKLEPFVTQEVEVTGSIDQAEAATKTEGSSAVRTLTVNKLKVRTGSCG